MRHGEAVFGQGVLFFPPFCIGNMDLYWFEKKVLKLWLVNIHIYPRL